MKSFFSGSAVIAATILASSLLLSAKPSVAETLLSSFQKPTQESGQSSQQDSRRDPVGVDLSSGAMSATGATTTTNAEVTVAKAAAAGDSTAEKTVNMNPVVTSVEKAVPATTVIRDSSAPTVIAGATYSATAYSLSGRTASGLRVTKGLIAADPCILPLGTRVRLDAGPYSGEYLVADTGGAVRGKKIDIWTPNNREAFRFGRRLVKLTVLSYPVKRAVVPRHRKR